MPQHPWIGKQVRPVDSQHIWRRSPRRALVKDVIESISGQGQVLVLAVTGFSTLVKQPLSDFELVEQAK